MEKNQGKKHEPLTNKKYGSSHVGVTPLIASSDEDFKAHDDLELLIGHSYSESDNDCECYNLD